MAGQPRSRGKAPARQIAARAVNRRKQLVTETRGAKTALDELGAAYDYFRGAVRRHRGDSSRLNHAIRDLAKTLRAEADALLSGTKRKETR
jgi:hypothetical protein